MVFLCFKGTVQSSNIWAVSLALLTLLVCREKNILANLTNSQEQEPVGAGCFWLLGAGAAWKKNQAPEPEPLGKKIRSRSRLKKSQEPEPEKKLPAPQPWLQLYWICSFFQLQ